MIIIKGTENDLSFITNSLHCKGVTISLVKEFKYGIYS